jgi:hypothetical protein
LGVIHRKCLIDKALRKIAGLKMGLFFQKAQQGQRDGAGEVRGQEAAAAAMLGWNWVRFFKKQFGRYPDGDGMDSRRDAESRGMKRGTIRSVCRGRRSIEQRAGDG